MENQRRRSAPRPATYGIHCGRVDLTFDLETRKLIDRNAITDSWMRPFRTRSRVMEEAAPRSEKKRRTTLPQSRHGHRTHQGHRREQSTRPALLRDLRRCPQTQPNSGGRRVPRHLRHRRPARRRHHRRAIAGKCCPTKTCCSPPKLSAEELVEIVKEERAPPQLRPHPLALRNQTRPQRKRQPLRTPRQTRRRRLPLHHRLQHLRRPIRRPNHDASPRNRSCSRPPNAPSPASTPAAR